MFVEKPLAITTDGCDRVLQAAYDTGARLYVGHNMRHMPVVLTMRELIQDGAIGDVKAIWCRHFVGHGGDFYFKDWHADRRRTTGLLLQKGAHDIDVMHWLAGGYTTRVNAMGALTLYGGIEDRLDRSGQRFEDFVSEDNWPPLAQKGMAPVMDVEDLSMANLLLDNGVLHDLPAVPLHAGLLAQLHGDRYARPAGELRRHPRRCGEGVEQPPVGIPRGRRPGGRDRRRQTATTPAPTRIWWPSSSASSATVASTLTSPVAARAAVAAGYAATMSLRSNGTPIDIPPLDPALINYFDNGQVR